MSDIIGTAIRHVSMVAGVAFFAVLGLDVIIRKSGTHNWWE